jgi:MraZ protein
MNRFLANFTLRLDSKGRVSIPSAFRAVLFRDGFEGLYCYPAPDCPAIDAGGRALIAEVEELVGRFAPFSQERERFALALYGTSETLKVDGEGRVMLSESLKRHAGISDAVSFVGLGQKFQMWQPGRFQKELADATRKLHALKGQPTSPVTASTAPGARE